ncbi:primosomal protein [Demequina sp.]|uniref:primosomal protein n=1 Tax=Demequina sp. TaxID=2050685 RepID=UPI003D11AC57
MSANAREALLLLTAALETHLDAIENRRSPEDAMVDDAYEALADAFERYEDALDVEFAEGLPMILDEDDELTEEEFEEASQELDPHAVEDDDELDDDLEEFDLRS